MTEPKKPRKPRLSIIPARAPYDVRLTPADLRVLAALGTYIDNDGWCYPQQATIATDLNLKRPTVSTCVANLAAYGYLETETRVGQGRGQRGLFYRVLLDPKPGAAVSKRKHRPPRERKRKTDPVSSRADIGAGVSKRGTAMSANADIGYIEGTPHKNDNPRKPPKTGVEKTEHAKAKRTLQRKGERMPPEFAEVWRIWPRDGSNKKRALKAWRAHRATALQKLTAVRAYLASKQATAKGGQFVPYLQRWLTGSLDSFVDVAARKARRDDVAASGPSVWLEACAKLKAYNADAFAAYWARCEVVEVEPLTLRAATRVAFDRLQRDHVPAAEKLLGVAVVIVEPTLDPQQR